MNPTTLNALIPRFQKPLAGLCYQLCHHHADAEDLYQETWLKLLRAEVQYRDDRSFYALLRQTCVNLYRDQYDKRRRELLTDELADKEAYLQSIPDPGMDLQEQTALYDAIHRLEPELRMLLTLCYLEGLSQSEIAGLPRMPLGSVKSKLRRAKDALRKELS